ncbi:hypothetical protein P2G88_03590 [Aliiglaciecola sp. CAU 1673]|uniref:hypothetical protein n=1 Tax=Aliiglaciecola sp. CAU 1673 TaxID=3032595 RepID=UPI0023DB63EC|nr:hypothetical protein [Aliiglaciecola sp. CAU 1673]MDF2177326.1 hypothetical protein [Aliiglaciecola sp. CAU 1673]
MVDENKKVDSVEVAEPSEMQNQSRRKWLKRASLAAPGLLLLANRPAMAAGCTISGFMSVQMGTSLTVHDGETCNGWSPGNWKNNKGEIGSYAWDMAGLTPGTSFASVFRSSMLTNTEIRRIVGGVKEPAAHTCMSQLFTTLGTELDGPTKTNDITQHATAALLNARFIQAIKAGTSKPLATWMYNYPTQDDIISLYLMCEMCISYPQAGIAYEILRGGVLIGRSDTMVEQDYKDFFVSIADGGGYGDILKDLGYGNKK